jgi:hypothetical protein
VEFDDDMDAEDAKKDLNGQDMGGLKINIGKQSLFLLIFLCRVEQEIHSFRPQQQHQTR